MRGAPKQESLAQSQSMLAALGYISVSPRLNLESHHLAAHDSQPLGQLVSGIWPPSLSWPISRSSTPSALSAKHPKMWPRGGHGVRSGCNGHTGPSSRVDRTHGLRSHPSGPSRPSHPSHPGRPSRPSHIRVVRIVRVVRVASWVIAGSLRLRTAISQAWHALSASARRLTPVCKHGW